MRVLAMAFLAALAASCSKLTVRVDVFDGGMRSATTAAAAVVEQLDQLPASIERSKAAFSRAFELAAAESATLGGTAEQYAPSYVEALRGELAMMESDISATRTAAQQLMALAAEPEPTLAEVDDVAARRQGLEARFRQLLDKMRSRFDEVAIANSMVLLAGIESTRERDHVLELLQVDVSNPYFAAADRVLADGERTLKVLALNMDDPDLGRIVGAPDRQWRAVFNRVMVSTFFGNAEIAIRMKDLGNFSLKGVIFDPSQVTKATLDGVAMAVRVAAGAAGVPAPATNGDGTGNAAGNGSNGTAATATDDEAKERARRSVEAARLRERSALAWRLLSIVEPLEADDATKERDQVVAALRASADVIQQLNDQEKPK